MSNDYESVDLEECALDEEVNCVFCGKLFPSIERIQEHISLCHESVDANSENHEPKIEIQKENKQQRIYDLNTEIINSRSIDYNEVVQCSKCDLFFVNSYASRMHFEKMHLGRKRKRSNNPNGVEGIIVGPNGTDNWGCDICCRQFPTLKQAKVHKFKSHIEPVQKKTLLVHRNILKKTNVTQLNYVKKMMAENKFREILPNSKSSTVERTANAVSRQQNCNSDDTLNGNHSDHNNKVSHANNGTGIPATNLWRAAQASSRGNKIVISRVYQCEVLQPGAARAKYGFMQRMGYSCFYCRETFLNKQSFKRHLLWHRKNKSYKCRNCALKFQRVRSLKQHQRLNCHSSVTGNNFSYNGVSVINQPRTVIRDPPHTIKIESRVVKNNVVQTKDEEVYPKDIKFAEKFLNNSSITLNKGSQCVCNLCQSCFYSNNSILRHLVLYHRIAAQDGSTALATNTPSKAVTRAPSLHFIHECSHCGSQFASRKGLQRHLQSVHQDNDARENDDNDDDQGSLSSESSEIEGSGGATVAQGRRVKCDVCGRRFRNPMTLAEHRRVHCQVAANKDDVRGARVPATPRRTVQHYHATTPAYRKAKVPPNADGLFECDECHKSFTCRSSLSNHVKSHFNFKNKPFSCSSCHQGFMSTLTLQHHREQLCPGVPGATRLEPCLLGPVHGPGPRLFPGYNGIIQAPPPQPPLPLPPVAVAVVPPSSSSVSSSSMQPLHSPSSLIQQQQQPGSLAVPGTITVTIVDPVIVPGTASAPGCTGGTGGPGQLSTRATSCMHCSAMFPDRSLLEDHASKEHSNQAGEVVCIICPRSFTTYMAFRVHMTKSHGGPNGTSLKSHLNTANGASLLQKCPPGTGAGHGPTMASTSMDLIQELSTSLSQSINGKLFQSRHACPNCDKDFSTSQALGNHKRACMPHLFKKVSL